MPPSLSRRDFLAAGAALTAGDLAAFPRLDGRPPGSLVPITTPEVMPTPAGAKRLGDGRRRMRDTIRGFRVNADSGLAVSATRDEVWVWDVAKRAVVGRFKFPADMDPSEGRVTSAGTLVMVGSAPSGNKRAFSEYALPGGALLARSWPAHADNYDALLFSDDGKHALMARTGAVTLYKVQTAEVVWTANVSSRPLGGLAFVPKTDWVAVSDGGEVKLLHRRDGKEVAAFAPAVKAGDKDDDRDPVAVYVSPAGDWLAAARAGDDLNRGLNPGRIAMWDLNTRCKIAEWPFFGAIIHISPDGKTQFSASGGSVTKHNLALGHTSDYSAPKDGQYVTIAGKPALLYEAGDTLSLKSIGSRDDPPSLADPPDLPDALTFRGPHRLLGRLPAWGGWVEWDVRNGKAAFIRPPKAIGNTPVSLAADGRFAVYRTDRTFSRLRVGSGIGDNVFRSDGNTRSPEVAVTDTTATTVTYIDGNALVCHDFATGKSRILHKLSDGKQWGTVSAVWEQFLAISVSSNGQTENTVEVWDTAAGVRRRTFDVTDQPRHAAVGPGAAFVAVVGQLPYDSIAAANRDQPEELQVLSTATGKAIIKFQLPYTGAHCQFSHDGRTVACHGEKTLTVWDLHGAGVRLTLSMEEVRAAAFSPDGKTLATAVPGGPVFLWNLFALPAGAREPDDAAALKAWESLAGSKCDEAFAAVRLLAAYPAQAVPLLKKKLPPAVGPDAARVKILLADLDHDQYRRREMASRELAALGQPIRAIIRDELRRPMSQERRTRLERLAEVEDQKTPADLRAIRAVEIAEVAATPAADDLLKHWATGFAGAVLTTEAKAALARRSEAAN